MKKEKMGYDIRKQFIELYSSKYGIYNIEIREDNFFSKVFLNKSIEGKIFLGCYDHNDDEISLNIDRLDSMGKIKYTLLHEQGHRFFTNFGYMFGSNEFLADLFAYSVIKIDDIKFYISNKIKKLKGGKNES